MAEDSRRPPHDDDTDEEDAFIDPELRLRTVRTAASTIAESIVAEQRIERRKTKRRNRSRFFGTTTSLFKGKAGPPKQRGGGGETNDKEQHGAKAPTGKRRNIYVNLPMPLGELKGDGEPEIRYPRNKVRTSKYTVLTFVPKNLYEQFRRVANLYFLFLVVLQVFPIFGAASPTTAMLPLVFILTVTALKDGIEDYRRASLDDQVNNSASTKLVDWRNVNQPTDPREWWEKLLGINHPERVTKGVRRLREKEALEKKIVLKRAQTLDQQEMERQTSAAAGGGVVGPRKGSNESPQHRMDRMRSLDDIQSIEGSSPDDQPPSPLRGYVDSTSTTTLPAGPAVSNDELSQIRQGSLDPSGRHRSSSVSSYPQSTISAGVVDFTSPPRGTARWARTLWKKLEVGDIVLLRDDDQIPADIVVLSTSDADGLCYVETKNLDGETNLKQRRGLRATSGITSEEELERARFVVDSEPPHANLYMYNGVLRYTAHGNGGSLSYPPTASSPSFQNPGMHSVLDQAQNMQAGPVEKVEPVTINELLLRGTTLRNTNWVIGLVVFTGSDTKIMMNGGDTPSKRSKIEKETNYNVIANFIILMIMCILTAALAGYFELMDATSSDFFETGSAPTNNVIINSLVTFGSCLVAFQNIVPISLYISIEIVKTIQAFFISQDVDMYYEPFDSPCVPKTWNISDDLGQIEYIFSDKTGTLTQNIMEFQKCSIGGVAYGEGITEAMRGAAKREGRAEEMSPQEQAEQLANFKDRMLDRLTRSFKNRYLRQDKVTLISPRLADDLTNPDRNNPQRLALVAFFKALAICHTVLADRGEGEKQFVMEYKAESPDEAALVAAARDAGFPFVARSNHSVDIEVMGQSERFVPLRLLEFNSTRKRMSVIVRTPDNKIVLYTKGADSVIYARLRADHDPVLKDATARDMESFANGGLRTLCIAYRVLTEQEYFEWSSLSDKAQAAVANREEEIEKANDMIERDLVILGATALEDKLQEGVPDAIELLHQAGIKLWILTGDKLQTAIEIGFSCNLLKADMEIMILSADNMDAARSQIEAGLNKIASIRGPPQYQDPADGKKKKKVVEERGFVAGRKGGFAVVIDGDTLHYALDGPLKPLFLNLGTQCETVVCCRVSPAQKALTVKLVKEGRDAMTLSIGDGANDVAMIQEANIGCGLLGLEGSQAAMSADYAFGQFRFLTKLLLVHGRWSYIRIADMHCNFFYKNVIWTFPLFWYLYWNTFDATYLYEYTFILLYNLVFTSLPVIISGALDQDINAKASLAYPQLYVRGIRGLEYTKTRFWLYMLDGLYQSVAVYFIPLLAFSNGMSTSWSGKALDSLADFGTTVAVAAIFAANIFVGLNTKYWTFISFIVILGSMLATIVWISLYSFMPSLQFRDEIVVLFSTVSFWTTIVLSIVMAVGPRFVCQYVSQARFPHDKDIVREMWVKGDLKDRLGLGHRRDKKNKNRPDPEDLSLFQPHLRSTSELSDTGGPDYEPVRIPSPKQPWLSPSSQPLKPLHVDPPPPGAPLQPDLTTPRGIPPHSTASYASAPGSPPRTPTTATQGRAPGVGGPGAGGEYEMRVRSPVPPASPGFLAHSGHTRAGSAMASSHSRMSNTSFVTADDGDWLDDDDDTTVQRH